MLGWDPSLFPLLSVFFILPAGIDVFASIFLLNTHTILCTIQTNTHIIHNTFSAFLYLFTLQVSSCLIYWSRKKNFTF